MRKEVLLVAIIYTVLSLSGCIDNVANGGTTGLELTSSDCDTTPICITAEFSEKPIPEKTVSVEFEFLSDYSDNEMPVTIELSDSISLVSGTLVDTLAVRNNKAQKTLSIKVEEPGYHKISLKAEAKSMGFTKVDSFYLEVTETDAKLYNRCPVDKIGAENC